MKQWCELKEVTTSGPQGLSLPHVVYTEGHHFPVLSVSAGMEEVRSLEDEENKAGVGEQDRLFKESSSDLVYFLFQPNVHGILFLSNGIVGERFIFRFHSEMGIFKPKRLFPCGPHCH